MILLKDREVEFNNESLKYSDNGMIIMHSWEDELMRLKAEFVCENGGDILELGFGMGISANYIQHQKINSHTICEIHPQVIVELNKWKKDKTNVITLEGDWYDNVVNMGKYDGILFDTFEDTHYMEFFKEIIPKIAKPNCRITWWNNTPKKDNTRFKVKESSEFEIIEVDPPKNTYFNHKQYYMPKYIHR